MLRSHSHSKQTGALAVRCLPLGAAVLCWAGAWLLPAENTDDAVVVHNAVAIIVQKSNPVGTLSSSDLKQIFSARRTRWPDGTKIVLLSPAVNLPEHAAAIRFLYGMSEGEYQKYCIQASFTGHGEAVPRVVGSSASVVAAVATQPGSIGFVLSSAANASVKLVAVDGVLPDADAYKIRIGP
jgi:phosphate transport system substrate-binding protein